MKHNFFYEFKMAEYSQPDEIADENADIKARLNLHIQQMTMQRDGTLSSMKVAIAEHEKQRLEDEVAELLADEQRATSMGGWA